jgi:hypothetical protein
VTALGIPAGRVILRSDLARSEARQLFEEPGTLAAVARLARAWFARRLARDRAAA